VYVDDQTSSNLPEAQSLVQNDHVFAVINDSAVAFLSYRWILDHDVPLIGGGFDGNYYGAPGNEKVISAFGNSPPLAGIQTTLMPKIMKALGARKVAALGYGSSPSSVTNVKSFMQYAVPAVGLESVYANTSIDFGTADVGPLALGIKNAGADGAYYVMDLATNLALAQALGQNGVKMKAEIMATGYGQPLLDQPVNQLRKSPPLDPLVDGRAMFSRCACDNKWQNHAHLKAVEAYLKTGTPLPCDLTFVIEGEEEVGSKSLASFLKDHHEELACDAIVILDTGMPSQKHLALTYTLRGVPVF
jgi:hypothetical protein